MSTIEIPNSVSFHTAKNFLVNSNFFSSDPTIILKLHPRWMHLEPFGLVMLAAWGDWCKRNGKSITLENLGPLADYAWRMGLFNFLHVDYSPLRTEHEEAGRFLPIRQVQNGADIRGVVGDISAILHLQSNPESLAAVQYCISELLRNVLEHSQSVGGAFVCAHNYGNATPKRITVAVADYGIGIRAHLGRAHAEAKQNDIIALQMAMRPGVTGALPGAYGTPDNAGAGLFITRSIAKGTGGYYLVVSGNACYRLRRTNEIEGQGQLFMDPFADRHDMWTLPYPWNGTIVSMEIRTDGIEDFESYFSWIRQYVPSRASTSRRIRFV